MNPVALRHRCGKSPLLFTCRHASAAMPPTQVVDRVGWGIGAAAVEELSTPLDATAVSSSVPGAG
jgi:predicted N-formylglutamate amidohydrolase